MKKPRASSLLTSRHLLNCPSLPLAPSPPHPIPTPGGGRGMETLSFSLRLPPSPANNRMPPPPSNCRGTMSSHPVSTKCLPTAPGQGAEESRPTASSPGRCLSSTRPDPRLQRQHLLPAPPRGSRSGAAAGRPGGERTAALRTGTGTGEQRGRDSPLLRRPPPARPALR